MNTLKFLVSFVAFVALLAVFSASASALANIDRVTVNGVESYGGQTAAVFAGETIPVRVIFTANDDASDVRVVARLLGQSGFSEVTERFNVLNGNQYSRLLSVQLPYDIDPSEEYTLEITVESKSDSSLPVDVNLEVQRSSYDLQILSVENQDQVKAGKSLILNVVLKNRGIEFAEDTYVRARIPQLGLSSTVYFGDLSDEDRGGNEPDKEDAIERNIYLNVPSDAPAGVYTVEIEAFNTDASTRVSKKVVVQGSQGDSTVVSSPKSKTFPANTEQRYTVTLVNTGDTIKVYELAVSKPGDLSVELDEQVVAVPAGLSKTVGMNVMSSKDGTYNFAVEVRSDGQLVNSESYTAEVEGNAGVAVDATVLLTVVLAIIFVVLVVVLIVLLTRKPTKKEEFGESYY